MSASAPHREAAITGGDIMLDFAYTFYVLPKLSACLPTRFYRGRRTHDRGFSLSFDGLVERQSEFGLFVSSPFHTNANGSDWKSKAPIF